MSEFIERGALIEEVESLTMTVTGMREGKNVLREVLTMYREAVLSEIKEAPAADVVEVKHGRWKLNKDGSGTCDQCRFTQMYVWDMDTWQNFCGHCGAKMDGGKDNG